MFQEVPIYNVLFVDSLQSFSKVLSHVHTHIVIILLVQVIIATPGRMIDLMDKQVAKMEQCRMLVLDEADKLLSQDFKGMLDMVISR